MSKPTFRYVDDCLLVLARTIGMIRTRIASMEAMAKYGETEIDFWDLMIQSQYDLVVIDAFKLIDEKNCSLFSLIKKMKAEVQLNHAELGRDEKELKGYIAVPTFNLMQHRHTQQAHLPRKISSDISRFSDISMIEDLLRRSESLIKKYSLWIHGATYSIGFNSIYINGNDELANSIRRIADRR